MSHARFFYHRPVLKRWLCHLLSAVLLAAICLLALAHSAAAAPHRALDQYCGTAGPTISYIHTATAANSTGDWTDLDNRITNDCPQAGVVVTATYTPGRVYDTHPLGVFYHGLAYKWAIFHEDQTPVPAGATYFVKATSLINNGANQYIFLHTATAANSFGDFTMTARTYSDLQPVVTPNYSVGNVYDDHTLGVWYSSGHWNIFHEDGTSIPAGASYNIMFIYDYAFQFFQTATLANSNQDYTIINNAYLNNDPNAQVFVIADFASTAVYDPHALGVWYAGGPTSGYWTIFHQDLTAIPAGATYSVVLAFGQ